MKKFLAVFSVLTLLITAFGFITPALAAEIDCDGKKIQEVEWLKALGIEHGLIIPIGCLCGNQTATQSTLKKDTVATAPADAPYEPAPGEKSFETKTVTTCGLTQIIQTIFNFVTLLLALTGSAALLMFTYGGVMFIIAFGSSERVQKAKQILTAAVIGIVIIFSAWLVINFVILALTGCEIGNQGILFSKACTPGTGVIWNIVK